jgi:hypothetical protein
MNRQDLGLYLIVWLISSALLWLLDVEGTFSKKEKILLSVIITIFVVLLRISVYLMIGE